MRRRTYKQYCPVARALDIVGDRWTLLIVRELLISPRRYSDLLEGIPGIATDLLAARLKDLEEGAVLVRRKLPPPAASVVYDLTDLGRELEPSVIALGRWGFKWLGPPTPDDTFRLPWGMLGVKISFRPEAAKGVHEVCEFRVDNEIFQVIIDDGVAEVKLGAGVTPDVVLAMDVETFKALSSHTLSPMEVAASGKVQIQGDAALLLRCMQIFGLITSPNEAPVAIQTVPSTHWPPIPPC